MKTVRRCAVATLPKLWPPYATPRLACFGGQAIRTLQQHAVGWLPSRYRRWRSSGMNYPAASCEVSNPRLRTPGSRQFGGGIFVWHAHLRTTPTGRLGDAVANSLFHCLAAAHTGE